MDLCTTVQHVNVAHKSRSVDYDLVKVSFATCLVKDIARVDEDGYPARIGALYSKSFAEGMDSHFGACRFAAGTQFQTVSFDLAQGEVFPCARKSKIYGEARKQAAGSCSDRNRAVIFKMLLACEKRRPAMKIGSLGAQANFFHVANELVESGETTVACGLARMGSEEKFEVGNRRAIRSSSGIVVHSAQHVLEELSRKSCGLRDGARREVLDGL